MVDESESKPKITNKKECVESPVSPGELILCYIPGCY